VPGHYVDNRRGRHTTPDLLPAYTLPQTSAPIKPFEGEWNDHYEAVRAEMLSKYARLGPQYRLLCEMVASAWTHIRRAEVTGLEIKTPEYTRAMELVRRLIDQAQRYTEARKSEIIVNEVNSAVRETLLIVETHLQDNPELFRTIVLAVRDRLLE